mmetsp:Transcript_68638/g.135792  ORF Transcript_68638/g.135792 Transcript_68638/m.135792 type:complete len:277 (-) Transcript_68638:422-1252(-)
MERKQRTSFQTTCVEILAHRIARAIPPQPQPLQDHFPWKFRTLAVVAQACFAGCGRNDKGNHRSCPAAPPHTIPHHRLGPALHPTAGVSCCFYRGSLREHRGTDFGLPLLLCGGGSTSPPAASFPYPSPFVQLRAIPFVQFVEASSLASSCQECAAEHLRISVRMPSSFASSSIQVVGLEAAVPSSLQQVPCHQPPQVWPAASEPVLGGKCSRTPSSQVFPAAQLHVVVVTLSLNCHPLEEEEAEASETVLQLLPQKHVLELEQQPRQSMPPPVRA